MLYLARERNCIHSIHKIRRVEQHGCSADVVALSVNSSERVSTSGRVGDG